MRGWRLEIRDWRLRDWGRYRPRSDYLSSGVRAAINRRAIKQRPINWADLALTGVTQLAEQFAKLFRFETTTQCKLAMAHIGDKVESNGFSCLKRIVAIAKAIALRPPPQNPYERLAICATKFSRIDPARLSSPESSSPGERRALSASGGSA